MYGVNPQHTFNAQTKAYKRFCFKCRILTAVQTLTYYFSEIFFVFGTLQMLNKTLKNICFSSLTNGIPGREKVG